MNKTKILFVNKTGKHIKDRFEMYGETLETVINYKCLGVIFSAF